MTYTTKDGKTKNSYVLSAARQDSMCKNGWRLLTANSYRENAQQLYDRLSAYYNDVRIYEETTRIAGLHSIFAMCK